MRSKFRTWGVAIACVGLTGYLAVCAYLFFAQRSLLYVPPHGKPPPAESGYRALEVRVPGLGALQDLWASPTSPRLPTIVFFHGNGSDRSDFTAQADAFRRRGWGVVLASYRGYSGNPGSPTEGGLMADARATLAAVRGPGPLIVWGHSLGSGVAARMASEGRVEGLVLEAPYTSLTEVAARRYPFVPVSWLMLDRFDTRAILSRIRAPVLIFHSTDDPLIPFAMGEELARRLGKRATLETLHGLGHDPHRLDLSDDVVTWAKAHRIDGRVQAAAASVSARRWIAT